MGVVHLQLLVYRAIEKQLVGPRGLILDYLGDVGLLEPKVFDQRSRRVDDFQEVPGSVVLVGAVLLASPILKMLQGSLLFELFE